MQQAFLFVIDPISSLNPATDTGLALIHAAQHRGHPVFVARTRDLFVRDGDPMVNARPVALNPTATPHYQWRGPGAPLDLRTFHAVFMRRDPPFDMDYIFATHILSLAEGHCRLINAPQGLRDCNEKSYILRFPSLIPPTLLTKDPHRLQDFLQEHGDAVIKPLDGKGGEAVILLHQAHLSARAIMEVLTHNGRHYVMMQRYVPESRAGDKRILMVDGRPLGAFMRVPASGELRGNLAAGATAQATDLTPRDLEICATLAPSLISHGLRFVGIDVLGPWLTEINVTSPTGVQQVRALSGIDVADALIAAVA